MSLLIGFDENSDEINARHESLPNLDFQSYIDQYGLERAKGYCDALHDLYFDLWGRQPYPFTIHRMSTQAVNFLTRNQLLIEQFRNILASNEPSSDQSTEQKYTP